ncbi:MAG: transcription elongation factor NusA [Candidatus Altiarchaeales archaeon ex4484_96]|nr:MAG: transcription elongation factor NusA [Candidatus Altiarchaeales archaeon ex4484_96]
MSLPICDICAKTKVLCNKCESKLQEGKISELDVEISKLLFELGEGEIGFERAIDTQNFIIILTDKKNIGKIIGKGGDNIRHLSNTLGKQIRVIGTGNLEEILYDFVAPARVKNVNKVYKTDGSIIKRVKIEKKDRKKLRMDINEIEKLIKSLTEENMEIVFA